MSYQGFIEQDGPQRGEMARDAYDTEVGNQSTQLKSPTPPLEAANQALEKEIALLAETVGVLPNRLTPVLQPDFPSVSGEGTEVDTDYPKSPQVLTTESYSHNLRSIRFRIEDLLARLDV